LTRVSGCAAGFCASVPFIPSQNEKAAMIATAEAARNATTQLAERLGFGRRLTSSVSQGSRSKSRAIVSPIGSAHLLGGSHAHKSEATAYDLPNA
jgi:hypothetical protein